MGGTLVVENYGSIQGKGGAANGGNGGNAIQADQTSGVTIINHSGGQIYAGGGGGGRGGNGGTGGRGGNGGTGGGGRYTQRQNSNQSWEYSFCCAVSRCFFTGGGGGCSLSPYGNPMDASWITPATPVRSAGVRVTQVGNAPCSPALVTNQPPGATAQTMEAPVTRTRR